MRPCETADPFRPVPRDAMRTDSRLSRVLHVLLHMADAPGPLTSEQIARMLDTHAVVVRRTLGGLRDAGYVRSDKGHGGGWTLACDLDAVTLLDVHRALGGPRIHAIGNERDNPQCAVERVVNAAIDDALRDAEALLAARFAEVSLGDLARAFAVVCKSHADLQTHE